MWRNKRDTFRHGEIRLFFYIAWNYIDESQIQYNRTYHADVWEKISNRYLIPTKWYCNLNEWTNSEMCITVISTFIAANTYHHNSRYSFRITFRIPAKRNALVLARDKLDQKPAPYRRRAEGRRDKDARPHARRYHNTIEDTLVKFNEAGRGSNEHDGLSTRSKFPRYPWRDRIIINARTNFSELGWPSLIYKYLITGIYM